MQEVFIRQLERVAAAFVAQLNADRPWPVQFVVTTHSPHMANEARFESLRYFLSIPDGERMRRSVVKDLRQGMAGAELAVREFRSEEHTSELQSLMRISYAVFCLKKKNTNKQNNSRYNRYLHRSKYNDYNITN